VIQRLGFKPRIFYVLYARLRCLHEFRYPYERNTWFASVRSADGFIVSGIHSITTNVYI
jgi:hypothetical protein